MGSSVREILSHRAGRLVFLALWLGLHVFCRTTFLNDPGTFSHTAYGEAMLRQGSLLRADIFTSSRQGQPWIAQQWLGEIVMALLHRIAGLDALLLAASLLVALIFSFLWLRLYESGMHLLLTGLLLAFGLASASMQFLVRPLLFTMAALAWLFALLVDVEAERRPVSHLWRTLPVFWLWANIHGGYLGGFGTLGLCVAGWGILYLSGRRGPIGNKRHLFTALAVVPAAGLMSVLGPYGIDLPRTWATIVDSPLVRQLIVEHLPLYSDVNAFAPTLLAIVYLVFLICFSGRSRLEDPLSSGNPGASRCAPTHPCAGPSPAEADRDQPQWGCPAGTVRVSWLVPVVWFLLAVGRVRHAPLFGITAVIAFAEMYRASPWPESIGSSKPLYGRVYGRPAPRLPFRTALVLLAVGLWLQASGSALPLLGRGWAVPATDRWPMELIPTMRVFADRTAPAASVYTEFNLGSWAVGVEPRLRVSIDDRCELAGDALMREYAASASDTRLIASWVAGFGARAALTTPGSPYDRWFRTASGWQVIATAEAGIWHERSHSVSEQ